MRVATAGRKEGRKEGRRFRLTRVETLESRMLLSITGRIEGTVYNEDVGAIAGVAVYIAPEDPTYRSDSSKRIVITDATGHYSFSDLAPGEYSVSLEIPPEYLDNPDHGYVPPVCATPTIHDLVVDVNGWLDDVDFSCDVSQQAIDVFFLGDDTASHELVNGIYFGQIQNVIDRLKEDWRFDWRFGIGRFEDFGEISGCEDDVPFTLNQALISDDEPGFDDLIAAAIAATHPEGWGGDLPESLNEGLYCSAKQAGFLPGAMNGYYVEEGGVLRYRYSQAIILAGTDDGTVYQEASPIVPTIYGFQGVPLNEFTVRSQGRNYSGQTIQAAVDALTYVGAQVIGLKSGPYITESGGSLPAYAKVTGAINYSEDSLTYWYQDQEYQINSGEPLVIHTLADNLPDVLAEAITNQIEYWPALSTVRVGIDWDGQAPSADSRVTVSLVPAALLDAYPLVRPYTVGTAWPGLTLGDEAVFANLWPQEYAVVVGNNVTTTRVYVHPGNEHVPPQPDDIYYPDFLLTGANEWSTRVGVHWTHALPDVANTEVNTPVDFNVLANDGGWGEPWNSGTLLNCSQPTHGTVSFSPDGSVHYTPPTDWRGQTSFQYIMQFGGGFGHATVTVNVGGPKVASASVGNASRMHAIATAQDSSIQLATVPVPYGTNKVTLTFDQAPSSYAASDLRIVDATRTHTAWATSVAGQGSSVTWTFNRTFYDGEMYLWLNDTLRASGVGLDGEWSSPVNFADDEGNSTFWDGVQFVGSGDGMPGGDFAFAFTLLPGDANRDGRVDDLDASILAAHWQGTGMTWEEADFTGDGVVNEFDASVLAAHWQAAYWQAGMLMMSPPGGGGEREILRTARSAIDALFAKYGLDGQRTRDNRLFLEDERFDDLLGELLAVLGAKV